MRRWEDRLDYSDVSDQLIGREAYRRTEFIVLKAADGAALIRIKKESEEALFSPIRTIDWLAGPAETLYLKEPSVDTSNATAMAKAALAHGRGWRAYIIEGLFEHVNFIFDPRPISIRVVEVIPPDPPKLLRMAQQAIAFDEELPPIELDLEAIDIVKLASENPAARYLLPCRGSGVGLPAPVDFLDERPARNEWTLIGCERSRQLYEWFYGQQPHRVELCPKKLATARSPALVKCCLLERGLEVDGDRIVVPWGASLTEVQTALRMLCGVEAKPAGPAEPSPTRHSQSE